MRVCRFFFFWRRLRRYRGANFQIRNPIAATDTPITTTCATLDKAIPFPGCNGFARGNKPFNQRRNLFNNRSEEHTSELQSHLNLVCRLLLEKKKTQVDRNQKRTPDRMWYSRERVA